MPCGACGRPLFVAEQQLGFCFSCREDQTQRLHRLMLGDTFMVFERDLRMYIAERAATRGLPRDTP